MHLCIFIFLPAPALLLIPTLAPPHTGGSAQPWASRHKPSPSEQLGWSHAPPKCQSFSLPFPSLILSPISHSFNIELSSSPTGNTRIWSCRTQTCGKTKLLCLSFIWSSFFTSSSSDLVPGVLLCTPCKKMEQLMTSEEQCLQVSSHPGQQEGRAGERPKSVWCVWPGTQSASVEMLVKPGVLLGDSETLRAFQVFPSEQLVGQENGIFLWLHRPEDTECLGWL